MLPRECGYVLYNHTFIIVIVSVIISVCLIIGHVQHLWPVSQAKLFVGGGCASPHFTVELINNFKLWTTFTRLLSSIVSSFYSSHFSFIYFIFYIHNRIHWLSSSRKEHLDGFWPESQYFTVCLSYLRIQTLTRQSLKTTQWPLKVQGVEKIYDIEVCPVF